ncbi:hypothetical protein BGW42_005732 [Actinomortierella wolfii]|nr:hypothetical protein BGW42_005732 [Actinomortierella wolfii]
MHIKCLVVSIAIALAVVQAQSIPPAPPIQPTLTVDPDTPVTHVPDNSASPVPSFGSALPEPFEPGTISTAPPSLEPAPVSTSNPVASPPAAMGAPDAASKSAALPKARLSADAVFVAAVGAVFAFVTH